MKNLLRLVPLALLLMAAPAVQAQEETLSADMSEPALTAAESCRAACERDFAICGDEGASARDTMGGRPSATQIDSLRCRQELKTCLETCRGL